jgi:hypothetical protein
MVYNVLARMMEASVSKNIGIVYCERIQDVSCVGCAKCYKSVNENTFAF